MRLRWFLCLMLCLGATARADDTIREIRFVGNAITRPRIMLQEMTLRVGDPVNLGKIADSRQAIMNLGLFESVDADLLPADEGGKVLQITVKEKYFLLPIPRANRNADGDINYGGELRWDNVAGLNQRLDVVYSIGLPAGSQGRTHDVTANYSYPRLGGSPYNLDVNARRLNERLFPGDAAASEYEHDMHSTGFLVSRFLHTEGPSRGWRVGAGLAWSHDVYDLVSGTPGIYPDAQSTAITAIADNSDVRDYLYSREGYSYGYALTWAAPGLNTDTYALHQLYWRNYTPIGERAYQSLDTQFRIGISNGYPGYPFGFGGADSMRGYPRGAIAGRSYAIANIEYLSPLSLTSPTVRGVVFTDIGNAYEDDRLIDARDIKTSVGIGLRLALKWFVKIQLRLDYAYGVNDGERKLYAGTKDAF